MNYLYHAILNPELPSLALFSTHQEARDWFMSYLDDALKMKGLMVAHESDLTYRFPEGGMLKFGYITEEHDVMKYRGCEWRNVMFDKMHLAHSALAQFAVAHLFKPIYRGNRGVI